ncbi:MAG: hypothetical protein QM621_01420 [Aeromicrobium sp.]|uniref:hypothetical protein n=1 Tax=Aeromicrobium sp. TaxID=1871063 RepID=UPI0039E2A606
MLRFEWEWQSAPEVRTPELRATWSTLQIDVGDVTATLVEDRDSRSGVRRRVNVPTYPLAEWLAMNWWRITSPRAVRQDGFRLSVAGDGLPWPDLTFETGPGYVRALLHPTNRRHETVRFLSTGDFLLEPTAMWREVRNFIEATLQQLDESGVSRTALHDEWAAIASADSDVAAFCRTAAALGHDPYDLDESTEALILELGSHGFDSELLADLAANSDLSELSAVVPWLREALSAALSTEVPPLALDSQPLPYGISEPPWKLGYRRARQAREALGLPPDQPLDVHALVAVATVSALPPHRVVGFAQSHDQGTSVVLPNLTSTTTARFAAARALGRRTFDHTRHGTLLTHRDDYASRVERAFAAEFLAPAAGIETMADDEIDSIAQTFGVAPQVIVHQLENQLGRPQF